MGEIEMIGEHYSIASSHAWSGYMLVANIRERLSMSSLFWSNLEQEKKPMKARERAMPSTRYEGVYHAAYGCQAASLPLTAARLRGLKWTYRVESKKIEGFFARLEMKKPDQQLLGRSACMLLLCDLKGGRLIAAMMEPHGKDDPDPHIGLHAASSQRFHGPHESKKGSQSPCRTEQFARSAAPVDSPASNAIWCE